MRRFVSEQQFESYPHPTYRVRCDLKDLPMTHTQNGVQQTSCSNCKERGIKCVYVQLNSSPILRSLISFLRDEFAEVKAVKLLRRGRRLQQVE